MILYDLANSEESPAYKQLDKENRERQYDFLISIIRASLTAKLPMISTALIKALNYHAVACLHATAGEYRPCEVSVGTHTPPSFHRVPALMDHFINEVNIHLGSGNIWTLAAYCLWRLNYIHPFVNGNGRTARALCYYVICIKSEGLLTGSPILPRLMYAERERYAKLLREADGKFHEGDSDYLKDLGQFVMELTVKQVTKDVGPEN